MNQFEDELDSFISQFNDTIKIIQEFKAKRSNILDLLTLICARLDGLSMSYAKYGCPNKAAFTNFITSFGGYKDLLYKVSVPNIYSKFAYYYYRMEYLVPKPGRIYSLGRSDDDFITFVHDIEELPLTAQDIGDFLNRLSIIFEAKYRVIPKQPSNKPHMEDSKILLDYILTSLKHSRKYKNYSSLEKTLEIYLKKFYLSDLLYEEYRNESIHGIGIILNRRRFYKEPLPYWNKTQYRRGGSYYEVEFPAHFLEDLLKNCLNQYKLYLKNKGKFPFNIWSMLDLDLTFMDLESLPDEKRIQLRTGR